MKNYYKILEINEYASQEVIKAAYKALAKKYHPDNCGKDMQKKRMTEINEAYQVLSDPEQKVKYDNFDYLIYIRNIKICKIIEFSLL